MDDLYRVADTETRLRAFGEAALVVVGAFLVGIVMSALGIVVLQQFGFTRDTAFSVVFVSAATLQYVGFFAVLVWYFTTLREFGEVVHIKMPGLRDLGWTIGGIIALFVAFFGLGAILIYFGIDMAPNEVVTQGRQEPAVFLYLVPVTVLFVAPAEELVFRGVVQGLLRRAYGVLPAILLASAIFGIVHYLALGGSGNRAVTILLVVALGGILGTVYELSGNVLVSIGVHSLWNVLVFLQNYVALP